MPDSPTVSYFLLNVAFDGEIRSGAVGFQALSCQLRQPYLSQMKSVFGLNHHTVTRL